MGVSAVYNACSDCLTSEPSDECEYPDTHLPQAPPKKLFKPMTKQVTGHHQGTGYREWMAQTAPASYHFSSGQEHGWSLRWNSDKDQLSSVYDDVKVEKHQRGGNFLQSFWEVWHNFTLD